MSQYRQFSFDSYEFDVATGRLELHYSIDDVLHFTEKYTFDFEFADYDPEVLDRTLQMLFFIAGVSYYKTFIPPEIVVKNGKIDTSEASFLSKLYQRGL